MPGPLPMRCWPEKIETIKGLWLRSSSLPARLHDPPTIHIHVFENPRCSLRRTVSCPTICDPYKEQQIARERFRERQARARKNFHAAFGDDSQFLPDLFGADAPFELEDVVRITIPRPAEG